MEDDYLTEIMEDDYQTEVMEDDYQTEVLILDCPIIMKHSKYAVNTNQFQPTGKNVCFTTTL